MVTKYRTLLILSLIFNSALFIYYLLNSDINAALDAFYYLALGDSLFSGTGLANITTIPPSPIYTPQNGIVFIHYLLQCIGLHNAEVRLCAIKLIHYAGFLLLIYIFYRVFKKLNISSPITFLSLGILLTSAHFLRTIISPLNEGIWCILTAIVFYLAILNENKKSFLIIGLIALSGIVLANFRLNGPIIILSIGFTYILLNKKQNSIIFFAIFILSYLSIFMILKFIGADCSEFSQFSPVYSANFIISRPIITLIFSIPATFMGITGSKWFLLSDKPLGELFRLVGIWILLLPLSIALCSFYIIFLIRQIKEKNFIKTLVISYIILLLLCLLVMPGGDSRYIIMLLPFTLLAIGIYFHDTRILRILLLSFLGFTILVSLYRVVIRDSIFFINNRSYVAINKQMVEPYMLISEAPIYSYFIFNKGSNELKDITKENTNIVIFGRAEFDKQMIARLRSKFNTIGIEYIPNEIAANNHGEIYRTIKVTTK